MIANNGLNYLSATEAIELIKTRKVSVKELIEASFDQIEKLDNLIHSWVYLDKAYALHQAETIDSQIGKGEFRGSLYGIPVGIKDIFNTTNMPTQMGSPIWKDFTPGNDARVVNNLKRAGAVIVGKTSTAEFAVHTPDKTLNPHNLRYSPGTSSGGSASAVAAYMVPVALGSQTAGSIIRPASYCGVIGFKPSFGLIPRTGVLKTTDSLDQIGFLVRAYEDLGLILDVIRVKGRSYPISHYRLENKKRQSKKGKKWRVGVIQPQLWLKDYVKGYVRDSLSSFVNKLSHDKDIEIVDIRLSQKFELAHKIHDLIYEKTLSYYFKEEYNKHRHLLSQILKGMIERGNGISLDDYMRATSEQENIARELDNIFKKVDVIITYSTVAVAMEGLEKVDEPDMCLIWTLCGVPVLNMPLFKGPHDLPLSLQAFSGKYRDFLLIKFISFLKDKNLIHNGTCPDIKDKLNHLKGTGKPI